MTSINKLAYAAGFAALTCIQSSCGVPEEYEAVCKTYKVYYDPKANGYICKFRDRALGGYEIYENQGQFYCKAEKPYNTWLYYGQGYPSLERAIQALELGEFGYMQVDFDEDLKIHYMGVQDFGLKERCKVICE